MYKLLVYYKQHNKTSEKLRQCHWCGDFIEHGIEYVGVTEEISDSKKSYRVECTECNNIINKLSENPDYAYEAFYTCDYEGSIRKFLRDNRCRGCIRFEEHENEGFSIKCSRRREKDEA